VTKPEMLALAQARGDAGHRTMTPLPVAAHIAGVRQGTIRSWKARGKVQWCLNSHRELLVDLGDVAKLRGRRVGRPAGFRGACDSTGNAQ